MTIETPDLNAALGDESECAAKLQGMWITADILPGYPATTSTTVELLRSGGGFDVSTDLLEGWVRSGMVPGVAIRAGRFAWSPQNILTAAIQADTWRRWVPCHPLHLHKMTAVELAEGQANAAGESIFHDLQTFDVNACVCVLASCDDPQMRRTFATALKTKLRSLGVLDK